MGIIVIISLLVGPSFAIAEPEAPDTAWTLTYTSLVWDDSHQFIECANDIGGSLIGLRWNNYSGYGCSDIHETITAHRYDLNGQIISSCGSSCQMVHTDVSCCHQLCSRIGHSVEPSINGGIVIAGSIREQIFPNGDPICGDFSYMGWQFRVDLCDSVSYWSVVSSELDSVSALPEEALHAVSSADGGIYAVGYVSAGGVGGGEDMYVVSANSVGSINWARSFGGPGNERAHRVIEWPSGGCVVAGYAQEAVILRLDENGDEMWSLGLGQSNPVRYMNVTPDSHIDLECGSQMLIIDSTGAVISTFPVPEGARLRRVGGGGYVTFNSSYDLIRLDRYGNTIWAIDYPNFSAADVTSTADGAFFLVGNHNLGQWYSEAIAIKTNAEVGISVLAPDGSESWMLDSVFTIQWFGSQFEGPVCIEINRYFPEGLWEVLVDSTQNDGRAELLITSPPSSRARVRISSYFFPQYSDTSDLDFSISSPNSYLTVVDNRTSDIAMNEIVFEIECNTSEVRTLFMRNAGNDSLHVYSATLSAGSSFQIEYSCTTTVGLVPMETSACSIAILFDPIEDGEFSDTLVLFTDAWNTTNGCLTLPIGGTRITTPRSPEVVIVTQGSDVVLSWAPITESIVSCPLSISAYTVWISETGVEPFLYAGYTADTLFNHLRALDFTDKMTYRIEAFTGSVSLLSETGIVPGITRLR